MSIHYIIFLFYIRYIWRRQ